MFSNEDRNCALAVEGSAEAVGCTLGVFSISLGLSEKMEVGAECKRITITPPVTSMELQKSGTGLRD